MQHHFLTAWLTVMAFGSVMPVLAAEQAPTIPADTSATPRTPWGDPDLQGIWSHGTATPLERPDEYAGRAFLTDEEIAEANRNATTFASSERRAELSPERDVGLAYNQFWWDRGLSDGRTALIIDPPDGRMPYTAEARSRGAGNRRPRGDDGPEDRNLWERCLTRGVPRLGGAYNNNFQLFQTPGHVVILHEMVHEVRVVPLDGPPHVGDSIRQWNGDSRGHWEGDTLVIDTTNFTGETNYNGSTAGLHVVERLTRADAHTLTYEVTLDDPTVWTRPWTAALALPMTEGQMYEYACHEGNYGMENLLRGARVHEQAASK